MKTNLKSACVVVFLFSASGLRAADIGTAFTYQGTLENGSGPVTDTCDFRFGLWNDSAAGAQVGGSPVTVTAVDVVDGTFSAGVDFGAGAINGEARWLEIEVQCPGDVGFTLLSPRVEITPAPHATRAVTGVGPPNGLEIDSANGRVGIGTSAPIQPLHVLGTVLSENPGSSPAGSTVRFGAPSSDPGLVIQRGDGVGGVARQWEVVVEHTNDLEIRDNTAGGLERMVIDTTGRVGIGTITPDEQLTVAGTVHSTTGGFKFPDGSMQTTADTGDTLSSLNCTAGEVPQWNGVSWACAPTSGGDGHSLDAADGSPVDALFVDNEGRVGIGTSTPGCQLDVSGLLAPAILDQQQLNFSDAFLAKDGWQSFTAGTTGMLTRVRIASSSGTGVTALAQIYVYEGNGTTGSLLFSGDTEVYHNLTFPLQTFDIDPPVSVTAGQAYTFRLYFFPIPIQPTFGVALTNPYPSGHSNLGVNTDMSFETYVAVEESGALLCIDDGGGVGIGTSLPLAPLHVVGGIISTGATGGQMTAYNPNNQGASVHLSWLNDVARIRVGGSGLGGGNGLDIQGVGDVSKLRILGNGNVGIGTTNPSDPLTVNGIIRSTTGGFEFPDGTTQTTADIGDTLNGLSCAINETANWNGTAWVCGAVGDGHSLDAVDGTPVDALFVNANGNVGIGTTSPASALDVVGTFRVDSGTLFVNSSNDRVGIGTSTPVTTLDVAGSLRVDSSTLNVDATNNRVGIGTSTPDSTLEVVGAMRVDNTTLYVDAGNNRVGIGTETPDSSLQVVGTLNVDDASLYVDAVNDRVGVGLSNPAFQLQLSTNSAAKPTSSQWTVFSDARLKRNVEQIHRALEQLLQLRGVTYEWIDPASQGGMAGRYTGLIAQEVEDIFPEWVGESSSGYKTLTVIGFEGLVVEALRDLQNEKDKQIAERDKRIELLAARLERLEQVLLNEKGLTND